MLEFDPATELECRVVFIFIWKLELLLPTLHINITDGSGYPPFACVREEIYPQAKQTGPTTGHFLQILPQDFSFFYRREQNSVSDACTCK